MKSTEKSDISDVIVEKQDNENCLVSVICTAYNHAKYIRQCLDGFVMQKTNFKFEVLINDDASTDGTADIIREYEQKYPEIIKPVYQKDNQFSKNVPIGKTFLYPNVLGKYLSECEGDDYWTDPYKLQKQVDFMEKNSDYSICFHPVKVIWEDKSRPDSIFPSPQKRFNKTTLSLSDLLKHNFIQTNSVMYRWCLKDKLDLIPEGILPMDWYIHLLHAREGKIGFLPDVMAVYRKNSGGIWYGAEKSDVWYEKYALKNLAFYNEVQKNFNVNKSAEIENLMKNTIISFLKNGHFDLLEKLKNTYPEFYKKVIEKVFRNMECQKRGYVKSIFLFLIVLFTVWVINEILFK